MAKEKAFVIYAVPDHGTSVHHALFMSAVPKELKVDVKLLTRPYMETHFPRSTNWAPSANESHVWNVRNYSQCATHLIGEDATMELDQVSLAHIFKNGTKKKAD